VSILLILIEYRASEVCSGLLLLICSTWPATRLRPVCNEPRDVVDCLREKRCSSCVEDAWHQSSVTNSPPLAFFEFLESRSCLSFFSSSRSSLERSGLMKTLSYYVPFNFRAAASTEFLCAESVSLHKIGANSDLPSLREYAITCLSLPMVRKILSTCCSSVNTWEL